MTKRKSFSKRYNTQQRLNAASIVQRLAFHQRLTSSQSLILKITPIWYEWCETQRGMTGARHFSAANDTTLSAFEDGMLCLSCSNKTTATLLKHQQENLLKTFHSAGFDEIHQLRIRVVPDKPNTADTLSPMTSMTSTSRSNPHPKQSGSLEVKRSKPLPSSIKSVEAVQRKTQNEQLSLALQRLIETLKKQ